jgi:hypothetical protein
MINAEDEITKLINDEWGGSGFSSTGGSEKDTIRVWMEVFVISGEDTPVGISINQNDGHNTGDGVLYGTANTTSGNPGPKPYVKVFYIKTTAPQITHPNVGAHPADGPYNSGSVTWRTESSENPGGGGYRGAGTEVRRGRFAVKAILDPNPKGTPGTGLSQVSYRVRLNNTYSGWIKIWDGAIGLPLDIDGVKIKERDKDGDRIRYDFEYAIDSLVSKTTANAAGFADLNNGAWAYTGGTMTVEIMIRDNAMNEASLTIALDVDNFAPLSDPGYRGNPRVAGSSVDFMGRVFDYAAPKPGETTEPRTDAMGSGAPRKITKVFAWFMKRIKGVDYYINLNNYGARSEDPGLLTISAFAGREADVEKDDETIISLTVKNRGALIDVKYPALGGKQGHEAEWVREISASTAKPGTRMLWLPMNSADYDIRWSFTLDSRILPDGPITLCYLALDEAGNAGYYTQDISVRNRYPQIEKITLITDNNGQGAAFTQEGSAEYVLNDYRGLMFNNYTDKSAHTVWDANPLNYNKDNDKLDTVGYLNSGFISKNKYLGFKVETRNGNRPLNFRVQHVKRERIALNVTNLQQIKDDMENPLKINLYTIAWHGGYSGARWKALGAPVDNPTLGVHFVPQFSADEPVSSYADDAEIPAEVWRYSPVVSRDHVIAPAAPNNLLDDEGVVEFGPDSRFDFIKTSTGDGTFAGINEFTGSHPDADDTQADNPQSTAFFLIRVWDTVSPENDYSAPNQREKWMNDQLYDALVVGTNVYVDDKTPPVMRLYDLNPYTETRVVNNNLTAANQSATRRNAADPQEIGANIARGGLWNTKTTTDMLKSGYIDPRQGSSFLSPVNSYGQFFDYPNKVDGDSASPGPDRDKVSGKIILRGIAWDDQLIDEIWIQIGGNPAKNILKLQGGKMAPVTTPVNYTDTAFAVEDIHWKRGHTVEWAYVWDTEADPAPPANNRTNPGGGPVDNVAVQVYVRDSVGKLYSHTGTTVTTGGTFTNAAAVDNINKFHNQVNVDIVSYVTGLERDSSKFETKRSLQGWYSFYHGETNIALLGYNLTSTAGRVAGHMRTNIGEYGVNVTYNSNPSASAPANIRYRHSFSILDGINSGRLSFSVGGGANRVWNETSSNVNKSWNMEYNPNNPGTALWNNKPHAHVWRTVEATSSPRTLMGNIGPTDINMSHPGMALQYAGTGAGTLHGTWAQTSTSDVYYGSNAGGPLKLHQDYSSSYPYYDPDISIFNGGGPAYTNKDWQGIPYDFTFFRGNVGFILEKGSGTLLSQLHIGTVDLNTPRSSNVNSRFVKQGINQGTRWQKTRISKAKDNIDYSYTNNVGRVYMSAYNSLYNNLTYGTTGDGNTGEIEMYEYYDDWPGGYSTYALVIDGGEIPGTPSSNAGSSPQNGWTPSIPNNSSSGLAATASAGQYSAIDYDDTGPVIAYYDATNDTVRVAFGANKDPKKSAGMWRRAYLLPQSHALHRGSGKYVSLKVDKANGIHIAFYNSNYHTVVYYYAKGRGDIIDKTPALSVPNAAGGNVRVHTIDNVLASGGYWTDISLDDDGNPMIVYGDNYRAENYDGVRVAYRSGPGTGAQFDGSLYSAAPGARLSCPVTGAYIGNWEALTMPANYKVNNDRLNIEAWPPNRRGGTIGSPAPGWNAAIGYGSDMYRIGYFYYPRGKGY